MVELVSLMNTMMIELRTSLLATACFLLLAATGMALGATTGHSAVDAYHPSATENRLRAVAGSSYACLVSDRGSYQRVKVSSRASAAKVRAYLKRRGMAKRLKISGVEIVPRRYELNRVLEAWINTLDSVPLNGTEVYGLSVNVQRTVGSVKRGECPHIAVTLSSWPGSTVSPETRNWALALAQRYPKVVRVTEHVLDERPIPPAA